MFVPPFVFSGIMSKNFDIVSLFSYFISIFAEKDF